MDALGPLIAPLQANLLNFFVVFLRVGAMVALLPAFGEQTIPVRVRLGVAIAFSLIVGPTVMPQLALSGEDFAAVMVMLGPEVLTGLFFGVTVRFFIFVLQIAGAIAAQSTSLSQIFGGSAGVDPQPAIGHVLVTAGLALASLMGFHVQCAAYIIQSYALVPVGVLMGGDVVADVGLQWVGRTFSLGFSLAAPFVIASLIYNLTLGVINKAMPQLMVSFVGAPAITAGGLILLMISTPFLLSLWFSALSGFLDAPFAGQQ